MLHYYFLTTSSKSSVYFVFSAHHNLGHSYFKGSRATGIEQDSFQTWIVFDTFLF